MLESGQLNTFVQVADFQSFSKAAQELGVSQSAISQSIKTMEEKIGVTLFARSGRSVTLTAGGEKLYSFASKFLQELDNTIGQIQSVKTSLHGEIRIGTLSGIASSWLAPRLLKISEKFPDLTLNLHIDFPISLEKAFENHEMDILVLPEKFLPQSGEKIFFSDERSTFVLPKTPHFDIPSEITFESISSLPTILFEPRDALYINWCKQRFNKSPKRINSRYIVNSHTSMLEAVSEGLGVAVLPTHVVSQSQLFDRVTTLGEEFEVQDFPFYIMYHKEALEIHRIQTVLNEMVSDTHFLTQKCNN